MDEPLAKQAFPDAEASRGLTSPFWIAAVVLVVGLAVGSLGVLRRDHAEQQLAAETDDQAVPTVSLVTPQMGVSVQDLVLPSNVEANYEAAIHARVSGYVKMWYRDIGARVKTGTLLAEIDTPDLDQQLSQAKADLASARADEKLAQLTAARWSQLLKGQAVSQQTTDEKIGDAEVRKAKAAAAQANVDRLNALEGFKRLVAPFDGVVTSRRTDVGALISAGGDSGPELFKVADIHQMRVYVRVPQAYASQLRAGMKAKLILPQYPDSPFLATLDTTSNAVSLDSRSILAEFIAPNSDGKLWPGTFAEAHIGLAADKSAIRIPTSSLLFRSQGLQVAILAPGNKVVLRKVKPGRDLGTEIEILAGVSPQDQLIDSPPDSLEQGDVVRVLHAPAQKPIGELVGPTSAG